MAKKNLGVKIFGWLFIILNLAIISYVIFQGWKYRSIFKEMGVSGFWNFAYFFIIILTIILTIVGPIIYVIAGVGILKLRAVEPVFGNCIWNTLYSQFAKYRFYFRLAKLLFIRYISVFLFFRFDSLVFLPGKNKRAIYCRKR